MVYKKNNIFISSIIFSLIIVGFILTQEDKSLDIVSTGSFGATTIDGALYNKISFKPEIRFKKLGVGLDISIYIDKNG